jgi:Carboxypeptidase regulatory-like domain
MFMFAGSTKIKYVLPAVASLVCALAEAQIAAPRISGTVLDPVGKPLAGAHVELDSVSGTRLKAATGADGGFTLLLPAWGGYTARVVAMGFAPVTRKLDLSAAAPNLTLRLEQVATTAEQVIVTADLSEVTLTSPDPSEKVMVREELLDANPGRPGAPVSIPGLPIETASGGIKAPQYFVPGVAGDHGEPIAQYIAVGGYLVTNNLSANAHGNGYADPNIYVSGVLGSVTTDGGAFNVLEGNHALNLAATYSLRPKLSRFLTLTGDYRDADLTAGFAPRDPAKKEWLAVEANFGNGLMKLLEHRRQFKWNALRVFNSGRHEITLFSLGYWGESHEGNLVPVGFGLQLGDTVDPRQHDQTHTSAVAVDDCWKPGPGDELSFSAFFRTYNLALFSNFGEGLIRQSEFRTVEGAEARETHTFTTWLQGMTGLDYHEDDIHRDNLDHYLSGSAQIYGPFLKVLSSNVTIRDLTPYAALHGDLGKHLRFYAGVRPDTIELKNIDLMPQMSAYSFDLWSTFLAPKATLAYSPGAGPAHLLPSASFSIGQAFFTQDPRISVQGAISGPTGAAALPSPFERSHSEQLALEKEISATDVRVTVGHTTTTETTGKIDPDNGTPFDLGPGTLKFLTVSVRHQFDGYGTLQAVFSKADARLLGGTISGVTILPQITPEAPRTIFDALATLDRLPLGLHARGEYEYVGHKLLDIPNAQDHETQPEAIPVGETRLALVRMFLNGRLEVGANGMIARGYTGQTTETFNPSWQMGTIPSCAPGSGPSGAQNDFDCGTNEQAVGVRMVSFVGGSISWRFSPQR